MDVKKTMSIRKFLFLTLLSLGLCSCTGNNQRNATFECAGPRSQKLRYLVTLEDPREWMVTHNLEIARAIYTYEIDLPTIPKVPTRYAASDISVASANGFFTTKEKITRGELSVDLHKHLATVDLYENNKPFIANGTYPLEYVDILPCPAGSLGL